MGIFVKYLLIINIIGFILYIINMLLYRYTKNLQIDSFLTVCSLMFGSIGIITAILLFDRKPSKENMMSRVFVICIFVIQIILLLVFNGHHKSNINLAFWKVFLDNKIFLIYFVAVNFIAFAVYALDKVNAAEGRSRIRIVTLLGLAFIGGSLGSLFAMYFLRHKTKKDYFTIGVPLIIFMQVVLLFYSMNAKW